MNSHSVIHTIARSKVEKKFPMLAKKACRLISSSLAVSTLKNYESAVRRYHTFCDVVKIPAFPVSELRLIFFVTYRHVILRRRFDTVSGDLTVIKKFDMFYSAGTDFVKFRLSKL